MRVSAFRCASRGKSLVPILCIEVKKVCVLPVATRVVRWLRPLVFPQFVTVALMAGSSGVYALQQAHSQPALSPDKEVSR